MTKSRQTLDLYMRCPLEQCASNGEKKNDDDDDDDDDDKTLSFNPIY